MINPLSRFIAWVKTHRLLFFAISTTSAALAGSITDAMVSGAQSYAIRAGKFIIFGWHPFPVLGWAALGPMAGLGVRWLWEQAHRPIERPNNSQGVQWRCEWDGRSVTKLEPLCPACLGDLKMIQAGERDTDFVCDGPGCGFRLRAEGLPPSIIADARRDLEGQAAMRPPAPPKPRGSRMILS